VRFAGLRRHLAVLPLVVLGALLPLLVSKAAFPDLSVNLDEISYLSQAEAIGEGELTRPASEFVPHFRPQLSGIRDDRVIFKFQPAWPAMLAASKNLTGSYRPALAVTGAAAVLAMYAFSYELMRRRVALLATIAFLGTPFVLVQSGTYLAYFPTVPLLLASSACLLRGLRTGRGPLFAAGGALLGLAFFHRGFDAVLWGVPLFVFLVLRSASMKESLRRVGAAVAGAAPFGLLYLAYNTRVTGSPTHPAFTAAGSRDTFGFGIRASYDVPGRPDAGIDFTLAESLRSARAASAALPDWSFGWYLGIALAVLGVVVHRREATTWLLVAVGAAFPAGYLFWWGATNATFHGLHRVLGPFYWLPVCAPLAVLVALGIEIVVERASERAPRAVPRAAVPFVALAALVVMAAVPMWRMWPEVNRSADVRSAFVSARMAPVGGRTLLMVNEPGQDPFVPTVVPGDLDEPARLTARVSESDRLDLMTRMSDRRIFEWRRQHRPEGLFEPAETVTVELHVEQTRRFVIPMNVVATKDSDRVIAYVQVGDETHETDLGPMKRGDRRTVDRAVIADEAARAGPDDLVLSGTSSSTIRAGVRLERGGAGENVDTYELRWEARTTPSGAGPVLELVVPATPWHRYTYPDGTSTWSSERVDPVLEHT
jgi:hypothetical protein